MAGVCADDAGSSALAARHCIRALCVATDELQRHADCEVFRSAALSARRR